jgi:putative flippase GtrA
MCRTHVEIVLFLIVGVVGTLVGSTMLDNSVCREIVELKEYVW